jgi:hypothetical protein
MKIIFVSKKFINQRELVILNGKQTKKPSNKQIFEKKPKNTNIQVHRSIDS